MRTLRLGNTDIITVQNGFGALPVQRRDMDEAVKILRSALDGGMTYFDTARAYTDSEEKIGNAFRGVARDKYYLASKTMATTPDGFWKDLETSLKNLNTDYIDVYQLHNSKQCYREGDGTGLYECMQEAKRQGKIRYISITCHKIDVATEAATSGLYATVQFPFSYLASQREIDLVNLCKQNNVGFIAMKGLAGGLITDSEAAYAYISTYDNVLPIWGIQRMNELNEWLSFMDKEVAVNERISSLIEREKKELSGSFCRSCGYCMPCPQGIVINQCARTSLMLRRAPTKNWLSPEWQAEMAKIETCLNCGQCAKKCPYGLDTPALLKANLEDYKNILSGKTKL